MNINGSVSASVNVNETIANGLAAGQTQLAESASYAYANGTGAGQCDLDWSHASTLAAGASDTYVLSALTDGLGRAVAFVRIRSLMIENPAPVDGDDLTIGGASTHPWSANPIPIVKASGIGLAVAMNATSLAVAAGSSDQLKVTNSGANPITYKISALGASV